MRKEKEERDQERKRERRYSSDTQPVTYWCGWGVHVYSGGPQVAGRSVGVVGRG